MAGEGCIPSGHRAVSQGSTSHPAAWETEQRLARELNRKLGHAQPETVSRQLGDVFPSVDAGPMGKGLVLQELMNSARCSVRAGLVHRGGHCSENPRSGQRED